MEINQNYYKCRECGGTEFRVKVSERPRNDSRVIRIYLICSKCEESTGLPSIYYPLKFEVNE